MKMTTLIAAIAAMLVLSPEQLRLVQGGYQTSPGAPFTQTPVKGENVVVLPKGVAGAVYCCINKTKGKP